MNVGLFFGSFNPIHVGHLIIGSAMMEATELQQVWFVVSPQNPFKKKGGLLHAQDRYDLVARAVHDDLRFRASDVEFHMPQPSYTVDTLTYLQEKHPAHRFMLLMGEDNLQHLPKWKNYERILECHWVFVYPRPGARPGALHNHPRVRLVPAPLLDISATFIRRCVAEGRSIRYLVPAEVEERIVAKKFYR
ncbi:MAG: nicotinate (nicotinamide) nucleotide adenylyltransferase [Catalinimonas sp.]